MALTRLALHWQLVPLEALFLSAQKPLPPRFPSISLPFVFLTFPFLFLLSGFPVPLHPSTMISVLIFALIFFPSGDYARCRSWHREDKGSEESASCLRRPLYKAAAIHMTRKIGYVCDRCEGQKSRQCAGSLSMVNISHRVANRHFLDGGHPNRPRTRCWGDV